MRLTYFNYCPYTMYFGILLSNLMLNKEIMNVLLQRLPARAVRVAISASQGISVLITASFATKPMTAHSKALVIPKMKPFAFNNKNVFSAIISSLDGNCSVNVFI